MGARHPGGGHRHAAAAAGPFRPQRYRTRSRPCGVVVPVVPYSRMASSRCSSADAAAASGFHPVRERRLYAIRTRPPPRGDALVRGASSMPDPFDTEQNAGRLAAVGATPSFHRWWRSRAILYPRVPATRAPAIRCGDSSHGPRAGRTPRAHLARLHVRGRFKATASSVSRQPGHEPRPGRRVSSGTRAARGGRPPRGGR